MGQPGYTIHGGQTDEDRLARQAVVMAAATMAFPHRGPGAARDGMSRAAGVEVTFVEGDAAIPAERDGFDLALSRLLLSHLVDPMAVVRAMCISARMHQVSARQP
jgi:hypothetical protein